jgi:trk system potassium uptake protein TrkH
MNYRATARPLGFIFWILALSMVFPCFLALMEWKQNPSTTTGFLIAIAISLVFGAALWFGGYRSGGDLHRKEGLFIVAMGWLIAGLIGSLPFVISGAIPSFIDALFESISGFTTTGASILTNIEALPRSILLWRSETHWLGGMGIVVLFVAILPALGIGGKHLFRFEATGPEKSGLHTRVADTARTLWLIYAGISLVEFLFLWAGGMPAFDAVCHTFGTMATGGFSTMNSSIGYYGTYFHVIITMFMFLCGVNFSLYFQAMRRRFVFWRDPEFRAYVGILGGAIQQLFISLLWQGGTPFWTALRDAAFTGTSIQTTTGYVTADFEQWTPFAQGLLVVMMFIGGSAGSTGGGMKVIRVVITFRWALNQVVHAFRPHAVLPLRIGRGALDRDIEDQVVSFFLLFIGWFALGAMVLLACGHDLVTSVTASIASVANIGPGLGMIGPTDNYADIHTAAKPVLCLLMLVGRLEVLAMTVLFVPGFWRK